MKSSLLAIKNAINLLNKFCEENECHKCPLGNICRFNLNNPSSIYAANRTYVSHWEEFDIDQDGYFEYNGKRYHYREDARFEIENSDRFKNFGGWLFICKHERMWETSMQVVRDNNMMYTCSDEDEKNVFPLMPIRIRFWRFKR